MDQDFRAIDLVCDLVEQSRQQAALVHLEALSRRVSGSQVRR
jgi:hypothetical protein